MKIIKKSLLIPIFFLLSLAGFGQDTPKFSDHAVKVGKASVKKINLSSHKLARMYRTNLGETLKSGINFAGRYSVSIWGCGSNCVRAAIINNRTGNAFFPKELDLITPGQGTDQAQDGIEFRKDSRLLIVYGGYGSAEKFGTWYYLWNGKALKLVKFVEI